jgi:hypothetical protein
MGQAPQRTRIQAVPTVVTFVEVLEEGPHTEHRLDQLQVRLTGRAIVGRLAAPAIPAYFFDDLPVEEQHAAVAAALNTVDESEHCQPGRVGAPPRRDAVSDRPRPVCPTCGQAIEPEDPDAVEAVEIVPVPGFGALDDTAEGLGVLFHAACFPEGDPRYRRL